MCNWVMQSPKIFCFPDIKQGCGSFHIYCLESTTWQLRHRPGCQVVTISPGQAHVLLIFLSAINGYRFFLFYHPYLYQTVIED